jgi:transposase
MRPKLRLTDEEQRAQLQAEWKDEHSKIERERLQTIKLAYSGQHTMDEIAELVGKGRRSVARWVKVFRQDGVAGLKAKPRGGARAKRTLVTEPTAADLIEGLKVGRWKRARDIQQWLLKEKKTKLSLPGLYNWLRRHKARPKVPRKSHGKKDPAKAAKFKVNMADQLKELGVPAGSKVRLWVADEHRYGLISVLRRVWSLRGYRPTAPYQTKYQWGYLYSALEVGADGRAEALFLPTVSLECSRLFLGQLAASDPQAEHIVIWDQAGFHQTTGPTTVPRVRILSLPPYSPELNPTEKLGILIKGAIGNTLFPTLRQLEDRICEELKPVWTEPARVRQLIGDGWLLSEANASSGLFSAI